MKEMLELAERAVEAATFWGVELDYSAESLEPLEKMMQTIYRSHGKMPLPEEIREQFLDFVKERNPKLAPLAELLTKEFTKSEASRELGDAWGTVTSRTDKLKDLAQEFLDNLITL